MFFLLVLGFSLPGFTFANPNLLVVGDSLSAAYGIDPDKGWGTLLANRLKQENYPDQVINISTSGDTTNNGLEKLPTALAHYHPKIVILALSANDALRGTPMSLVQQNLSTMVKLSQTAGAKVLLVEFLIPVNDGPFYREQMSVAYQKIVEQYHLVHVPFRLQNIALNPALMQKDGLHPTAAAQPLILDNVWPHLQKLLTKN